MGEWSDPGRVAEFLSREIPHRDTAERLLLEALPGEVASVVDLGTGDGRLLALVREQHPQARCVGLDNSAPMLELARGRFEQQDQVELCVHDLDEPLALAGPFDVVVSGLAIHHLEDRRKQALFGEIFELLEHGGVFANLDLVSSPSAAEHERFRREIGRIEDDPSDRLASLEDQLGWIRKQGFEPVSCQFKWLELTLVIAVKPASRRAVVV